MTAQPAAACVSAPAHPLKILQIITKGETGGAQTHVQVLCASLAAHAQVQLEIAVGGRDPSPPLERSDLPDIDFSKVFRCFRMRS